MHTGKRCYLLPIGAMFKGDISAYIIKEETLLYKKTGELSPFLNQFIDNAEAIGKVYSEEGYNCAQNLSEIDENDWLIILNLPIEEEKATSDNTKYYLIGGEAHGEYCLNGFEGVLSCLPEWEEYVHYQFRKITSLDEVTELIQDIEEDRTHWLELSQEEGERMEAAISQGEPDKFLHVAFEDRNMNNFRCCLKISEDSLIQLSHIRNKWLSIKKDSFIGGGIEIPMDFDVCANLEAEDFAYDVIQGEPILGYSGFLPTLEANNMFRSHCVFVNHLGIKLIVEDRHTGETAESEEISLKWLKEEF